MGFDVSYHTIPWKLFQERVFPWLSGDTAPHAIDDLIEDAVRIAKVRHRANAWGRGVLDLGTDAPPNFEPSLHVWGRPFFITLKKTSYIAEAIDRYLAAQPHEVDGIAHEMLEALEPGLSTRTKPSNAETLLDDVGLTKAIRWRMDMFRTALMVLKVGGGSVESPDGKSHDAYDLIRRDLPHALLEFGANFRPGWMDRGMVWPSHLLTSASVITDDVFLQNTAIVSPYVKEFPLLQWFQARTITENRMVGATVSRRKTHELRRLLATWREDILAPSYETGRERATALSLQKIDEALGDAQLRKLPFAEATEVYDGVLGTLN